MPEQRLRRGTVGRLPRQPDLGAVQRVVIPPVLELLLDPPTDLEVIVRSDGDVAGVEQLVDVGAEEDAVGERMLLHVAIIADMRRFQSGKRLLIRDGAAASVRVENSDAKAPLPEAGTDERRLAVTGARAPHGLRFHWPTVGCLTRSQPVQKSRLESVFMSFAVDGWTGNELSPAFG